MAVSRDGGARGHVWTGPASSRNWHVDFPTVDGKRIFPARERTHATAGNACAWSVLGGPAVHSAPPSVGDGGRNAHATVDANSVKKSDEPLFRKLLATRFATHSERYNKVNHYFSHCHRLTPEISVRLEFLNIFFFVQLLRGLVQIRPRTLGSRIISLISWDQPYSCYSFAVHGSD